MEEFDTSGDGAHPNWPDRFFAKIVDAHISQADIRGGRVGEAASYLLPARALLEFALRVMKTVASDTGAAQNVIR